MDRNITIWTCDRCNTRIEIPERDQPGSWIGVAAVSPPKASWELAEPRVHLCAACASLLEAFLHHEVA